MANGKKTWFFADGYLPYKGCVPADTPLEGHEAIMILNCNEQDAHVQMEIYYEDQAPSQGIVLTVPAQRIRSFHVNVPEKIGGVKIEPQRQYALRFESDVEVVIQYGRMDLSQPNLAYMALIGHGE